LHQLVAVRGALVSFEGRSIVTPPESGFTLAQGLIYFLLR
jgi:hypothetical protein